MKTLRMSKGQLALAGTTGVGIVLVILMGLIRSQETEPEPPEEQPVLVSALRVEALEREDIVLLPGLVEAWSDIQVAVEQAGRITALHVDAGDRVELDAPLLTVDDRLWKAVLERAEVQLRDARRDLERIQELRATGAVSVSELDAVESRARLAEIALEEAQVQVARCAPVAPLAGVVDRRYVSVGEYVQPGRAVFRLVDTGRVKIRFDVPERDIRTLRAGDQHRFLVSAVPDAVFTGSVHVVAQAADPGSSAFAVELAADNPDGVLRPGMIVQVELLRGVLSGAVILPIEAVVPLKGETVAYTVEDGRAIRRIVRIGAFLDTDVLVREGLEPGELVILDGNRAVLDGTPVRVQE